MAGYEKKISGVYQFLMVETGTFAVHFGGEMQDRLFTENPENCLCL